jgi:hypothetical protein
MRFLLITTLLLAPLAAHAKELSPAAQELKSEHASALETLRQWIQLNPQAAALLKNHPNRSKRLITWALEHPNGSFDDFKAVDPLVMGEAAPASIESLMKWARTNPDMAKELTANHVEIWDVVAEALQK